MIKLSVRGLPRTTTEESLTELFSKYGRVHNVKLVKDLFTGECKGFATVDMEGHEARSAIAALDGNEFQGRPLRVGKDRPRDKRSYRRR